MTTLKVATGQKFGATAKVQHISDAVQNALDNAGLKRASSVLLFLSNAYLHEPKEALKAASKTAGTLQVFGSTAVGLITEKNYLLDQEGAVAMVFPEDCDLQPASILAMQQSKSKSNELPLLCLTSPEQSETAVSERTEAMIGAITSNIYSENQYPVWQGSRLVNKGYIHAGFHTKKGTQLLSHTAVSQGIRRISGNLTINKASEYCLETVDKKNALESLTKSIPENVYSLFLEQPHHTLCAFSRTVLESDASDALHHGFYTLSNVVSLDKEHSNVFVSDSIKQGQQCFWALRDKGIAKQEMESKLRELSQKIKHPAFAFMFSSESRGPYFYADEQSLRSGKEQDTDLALFQKYFPNTPLIGIYSNGEISKGYRDHVLLRRYSCVVNIFEQTNISNN